MDNKIDVAIAIEDLAKKVNLNGFYVISVSPNLPEIKLQGYFTRDNVGVARKLNVELVLDEHGYLRGNNGFVYIVLTD
jgi:hypothetical protein